MKSVKAVTYGAMSVGLISIFLLADRLLLGNLGFIMSILVPVPLVIYGFKFSFKESVAVYLTMVVASIIFNGLLPAVVSVACFGLIGLEIIYTHEQEYSFLKKNVLLFLSMSAIYAIMIIFFESYFGLSVSDTIATLQDLFPKIDIAVYYLISLGMIIVTILMEMYILDAVIKLLEGRLVFKGKK